jgi:cysteinyl-tRNA synthetase
MSKSLGNLITIKDALVKYSADAIRIYVLSSHYRSPLTYSEEILEAAEKGAERLRQTVNSPASGKKTDKGIDAELYRQRFVKAMDDDFNTAQAVAALFDLAREINRYDSEGLEAGEARKTMVELGGVMGLTFKEPERAPLDAAKFVELANFVYQELNRNDAPDDSLSAESTVDNLLLIRQELRQVKQWQQADMIRAKLDEAGITFEDTPQGTVWRRKR